jgi:hypothetical protein
MQFPITAIFRRLPMAFAAVGGCIIYAIGYLLFGVARTAFQIHTAAVIWTMGEIMLAVPTTTFATDIAPSHLRARYAGASALDKAIGGIAAPILGTTVLGLYGGRIVMFGATGLVLGAAIFYAMAERERTRRLVLADAAA